MCSGADTLIVIRPLERNHREHIHALLVDTDVFSNEEVGIALELIDTTLGNPQQKDYEIFTAINESGHVMGYYCIGPTPGTVGTFDLYWIAVKPSLHDKGIGKQLLHHAESRIASHGGRLVVAETSSQPKYEHTRRFYLNNHYAEVARIKDYYKRGDDLVVYGKYLSQS